MYSEELEYNERYLSVLDIMNLELKAETIDLILNLYRHKFHVTEIIETSIDSITNNVYIDAVVIDTMENVYPIGDKLRLKVGSVPLNVNLEASIDITTETDGKRYLEWDRSIRYTFWKDNIYRRLNEFRIKSCAEVELYDVLFENPIMFVIGSDRSFKDLRSDL